MNFSVLMEQGDVPTYDILTLQRLRQYAGCPNRQ